MIRLLRFKYSFSHKSWSHMIQKKIVFSSRWWQGPFKSSDCPYECDQTSTPGSQKERAAADVTVLLEGGYCSVTKGMLPLPRFSSSVTLCLPSSSWHCSPCDENMKELCTVFAGADSKHQGMLCVVRPWKQLGVYESQNSEALPGQWSHLKSITSSSWLK